MAKTLRVFGLVWCWGIAVLIAASLAVILYRQGFDALSDVLSPFNVANFIVTALAFAPGALMLWGADKIEQRVSR